MRMALTIFYMEQCEVKKMFSTFVTAISIIIIILRQINYPRSFDLVLEDYHFLSLSLRKKSLAK